MIAMSVDNFGYNIILSGCETSVSGVFGIGKDNTIPWKLQKDLKHFKNTTNGNFVMMGKNTWDSLPLEFKPLSGRINIVIKSKLELESNSNLNLSSNSNLNSSLTNTELYFFDNVKSAYEFCLKKKQLDGYKHKSLYVIGGRKICESIYELYPKYLRFVIFTEIASENKIDTDVKIDLNMFLHNKKLLMDISDTDIDMITDKKMKFKICIYT